MSVFYSHQKAAGATGATGHGSERGVALLLCLILLICVAVLGIYGMRSVMLGERIAGNTLEKQRSLQAAETALRYGEWWLLDHNQHAAQDCAEPERNGNNPAAMRICKLRLSQPATVPWLSRTEYQPPNMAFSQSGGLSGGDVNYYAAPQLHIHYLGEGVRLRDSGRFFEISGAGYGGQKSTVSVLQSTFVFAVNAIDLGGL